jgi:hypothetical protein
MRTTDRPCNRTLLALPWLLNGSLEAEERRAVREHLIACPDCRAELARTRAVLAAFQAGRRTANVEPAAAAGAAGRSTSFRRRSFGPLPAHRLAWAAMVAAVLASGLGLWFANRSGEHAAQTERGPAPAAVGRERRAPAPRPAEKRDVIAQIGFEGGPLAGLQAAAHDGAASAPAPSSSNQSRPVVRRSRHTTPPPASQPTVISSMGFENGDLGEWN